MFSNMLMSDQNVDPYWSDVILALPFFETAGATSFSDVSLSGHAVSTAFGSPVAVASPTKFGGMTSISGNGTGLKCSGDSNFTFNTGVAMSFDQWFYRDPSDTSTSFLFCSFGAESSNRVLFSSIASGAIAYGIYGTSSVSFGGAPAATGVWNHIGITRDASNVVRAYLNGTALPTTPTIATLGNSGTIFVGSASGASTGGNRNWQQARLTRGVVRDYSIVPEAPFPTQ